MARFFHRRPVLIPTPLGAAVLLAVLLVTGLGWWFGAEPFLATNERVPADVIVVEAWMHEDAARVALEEFKSNSDGYSWIVATGGMTGESWSQRPRWNQVQVVERVLKQKGFPMERFVPAFIGEIDTHRTYAYAIGAREALAARGIRPKGILVITQGAHARRSRLTFARVFGSDIPVGVLGWQPPEYAQVKWWNSSERAVTLLKESVGYVYELLLYSGRLWR